MVENFCWTDFLKSTGSTNTLVHLFLIQLVLGLLVPLLSLNAIAGRVHFANF